MTMVRMEKPKSIPWPPGNPVPVTTVSTACIILTNNVRQREDLDRRGASLLQNGFFRGNEVYIFPSFIAMGCISHACL